MVRSEKSEQFMIACRQVAEILKYDGSNIILEDRDYYGVGFNISDHPQIKTGTYYLDYVDLPYYFLERSVLLNIADQVFHQKLDYQNGFLYILKQEYQDSPYLSVGADLPVIHLNSELLAAARKYCRNLDKRYVIVGINDEESLVKRILNFLTLGYVDYPKTVTPEDMKGIHGSLNKLRL